MSGRRDRGLLPAALLLGAGVASMVTALATYFTRYSRFDGLFGEMDGGLYAQLTRMAPAEKSALVLGALLVAGALMAGTPVLLRRPAQRR